MLGKREIDHLLEVAKAFAPQEMCGLMFPGYGLHVLPNKAENPLHHFKIDHLDYVQASMQHDTKPWAIAHSHATRGAAPSSKDCQLMDGLQAVNQPIALVIVGLQPEEIRVFRKVETCYKLEFLWERTTQGEQAE